MTSARRLACCMLVWLCPLTARAGGYEDLDVKALRKLAEGAARPSISSNDLIGLPALFRDTRSALLVVKTDQGNYARVLVSVELQTPQKDGAEPTTVFAIERFETFDPSRPGTRRARGRDMVLFEGFQLDLDSGQIVPEGFGADLRHRKGEKPELISLGESKLYIPEQLSPSAAGAASQPSPGRVVVPSDFAGRYRLYSNGQWTGTLDLAVDPKGVATGTFRSDLQGSTYAVTGQVEAATPGKILFSITFPRSRQEFEGYLWNEGKGAMAGTTSLLERTFGFFAIREGGKVAPEEVQENPLEPLPNQIRLTPTAAGWQLDGQDVVLESLKENLRKRSQSGNLSVRLEWPSAIPASRLPEALDTLRAAGLNCITIQVR